MVDGEAIAVAYRASVTLTGTTIRVFIHVLAATVWVGGQLVLGGLVSTLREIAPDAPKRAARRFGMLAWPAYGVLLFTGIWNALAIDIGDYPASSKAWFGFKMTCFLITGAGAALHSFVKRRWALALGGAAAALGAIGTLLGAVAFTR
jgi:putative copper export protein